MESLSTGGLLILGAVLRLHRLTQIPYPNETADEYAFIWSGWSFLHTGIPTAWSRKVAYGDAPVYLWNGFPYRLVSPWFDHPLLYSVLVGWATSLAGATEMLEASLSVARLVSIALSMVSIALLYLLARRNYGRLVAFISAILFATIPTIVVTSRLAVAESLIVPLLLGSLLATQLYLEQDSGRWPWVIAAGVAAGAAGLAKVPGLTVGISVVLLLLGNEASPRPSGGRWRAAAVVSALVVLVGIVPYVLSGLLLDRSLFAQVVFSQTERATGLDVLPNLLLNDVSIPVTWRDAWFPFLWIALVYVAARRDRLISFGIGPYLIFLIAAVSYNDLRAPYREPLFPLLCLAGGVFLADLIARPDLLRGALVVFGVAFGKLTEGFDGWTLLGHLPDGYAVYPFLVAALALPLIVVTLWPGRVTRWSASALVVLALGVALAGNLQMIAREDDLYLIPRPPIMLSRQVDTANGPTLTAFRIEPDTIPPGGSVRLWTTWTGRRDASNVSLAAYLRSFDLRTNAYGPRLSLGEPFSLTQKSGDTSTVLLSGSLPSSLPEGDYDLGVSVAGDPVDLGVVRVRPTTSEAPETQTVSRPTTFSGGIALDEALVATPRPSERGIVQSIGLRFRAIQAQATPLKVFVHLEDAAGRRIAQSDAPIGPDTGVLPVDEPIDEWRDLVILPETPPGRYYFFLGVYEPISGQRLATGEGSDQISLGLVTVGAPLTERDVPHHLDARFTGGIDLVGYDLRPTSSPERQTLTLYWRATSPLANDYTVFVHVVDSDGKIRAQADGPPDGGRVPTSTWRAGQIIPDSHVIARSGLPNGVNRVLVGLYLAPHGAPLPLLGRSGAAAEVTTMQVK